jgi:hypothetical protein
MAYYRTGALEPNSRKYTLKAYEREFLMSILHWNLANEQSDRLEAVREAIRQMGRSSVKRIGMIYGTETVPECLEGSWFAEKWKLKEEQSGQKKLYVLEVPEVNHYFHFYDTKRFWDACLECSV